MTVSGTNSRERYDGNDVTVNFPITFAYGDDVDINVTHIDALGVETPWVLDGGGDTGFTIVSSAVVANTAPATGTELVIYRVTPITQETAYVENRATPALVTANAMDKLTMIDQERQDASERAMTLPVTADPAVSAELPLPEANKLIVWNDDADAIENISAGEVANLATASEYAVDQFVDGVDFTAGVTTELTLAAAPGSEKNTQIYFDGVYQAKTAYSLSAKVLTFSAAIPGGTSIVEVVYASAIDPQVIPDASVEIGKLTDDAVAELKTGKFRGAVVKLLANQAIATSTYHDVTWAATNIDTENVWAPANPKRLTVPTGVTRVRLKAQVALVSDPGSDRRIEFKKNGGSSLVPSVRIAQENISAGDISLQLVSPVLAVVAGDYFELEVWQFSGSSQNIDKDDTWAELEIVE